MPGKGAPGQGKGKGRSRKFSESDDGKDQVSYEVYESAANTFFNNRDYNKAIKSYTKALEIRQGELSCLLARSKCYQELGNLEKANKDADDVLKAEPIHVKGTLQKGEVLYSQGDFENALVYFHRGKKNRPEIREFTLGIQKSTQAIENAVGPHSGVELRNSGDLSYFYEAQQQKQGKRKGYNRPASRREDKKKDQRPQSMKQDSKTIKQLLGELYADREYLDRLITDIDDNGVKTETNDDIRELAIEGLRYLNSRSEFWQQQKPMYSRKRDKEMRDGVRSRASSAGGKYKDRTQWCLSKLEDIDDAQTQGEHEKSLKLSRKTLKDVEKWSDDDVQNRAGVIANLHSFMGNAYLEMEQYDKSLSEHNKDLEIANQNDIDDAKSRALDNLGRVYARMGKFEKAVDVWEDKLPMAKSALEKTWLYHEIGRCYLEMGKYETARDYGEKSLAAAEEAEDDVWQLNATVLVAQSQVKCKDYQASLDSFEKALDMAKLQNDKQAENAIKKALDDVNKKIVKGLKDGDIQWQIKIYTTDKFNAGTDANVYIFIHGKVDDGTKLKSRKITLDNKANNFESGKCDEFDIETKNFVEIESVQVGHDNSGMASGWHLEKVELTNKETNKSFTFPADCWLDDDEGDKATERHLTKDGPKDSDRSRSPSPSGSEKSHKGSRKGSPHGKDKDKKKDDKNTKKDEKKKDEKDNKKDEQKKDVKWLIKIHTTDMRNAGTDADVFIIMYGKTKDNKTEKSEKIEFDSKDNNFESGNVDEFEISAIDLEKIEKIRIGHNNGGCGWHLEKVEIENKSSNKKKYVFHCDQWLDDDEGDKAIERDLTEGVKQKNKNAVPWIVKIHTTDDKDAGTSANVYISLFGKFDGKENIQSDKFNLNNSGKDFEPGKCNEFDIEAIDFDKLTKLKIGHDNSGGGWHLNKVELKNKNNGRKYTFECDEWLDDDKGDKKLERDLDVEDTKTPKGEKGRKSPKGKKDKDSHSIKSKDSGKKDQGKHKGQNK